MNIRKRFDIIIGIGEGREAYGVMDAKRKETCCFTGHRAMSREARVLSSEMIKHTVRYLVRLGVRYFIVGGALGFDTVAAVTLLNMRDNEELLDASGSRVEIELEVAVPCRDQSENWSFSDRSLYNSILASADRVSILSKSYTRGCMHKRNRYMVDKSAFCVCYVTRSSGGSYYTMSYAKISGLEIINLATEGAISP